MLAQVPGSARSCGAPSNLRVDAATAVGIRDVEWASTERLRFSVTSQPPVHLPATTAQALPRTTEAEERKSKLSRATPKARETGEFGFVSLSRCKVL